MNSLDDYDNNPEEALISVSAPTTSMTVPWTAKQITESLTFNVHDLQPGDMIYVERNGVIGHLAVVKERVWSTPIKRHLESVTFSVNGGETLTLTPQQLIDEGWKKLFPISLIDDNQWRDTHILMT